MMACTKYKACCCSIMFFCSAAGPTCHTCLPVLCLYRARSMSWKCKQQLQAYIGMVLKQSQKTFCTI